MTWFTHKQHTINLDRIVHIYVDTDTYPKDQITTYEITFFTDHNSCKILHFSTEKERNDIYEQVKKILDV